MYTQNGIDGDHMMWIYPIVRMQFSFAQFSLLCYDICILSKTECKSIYYDFRLDHESSSFRKLARNKWICQEICDFFSLSIYFISHQFLIPASGNRTSVFIQSFVEAFEIRGWHFLLVKIDFLASGTYFFLFLRYCF